MTYPDEHYGDDEDLKKLLKECFQKATAVVQDAPHRFEESEDISADDVIKLETMLLIISNGEKGMENDLFNKVLDRFIQTLADEGLYDSSFTAYQKYLKTLEDGNAPVGSREETSKGVLLDFYNHMPSPN